jgi:hypothetical protein
VGPGVGGERVGAEVASYDAVTRVGREPVLLDDVGDLPAGRTFDLDAGIQTEQGHGVLLRIGMLLSKSK